MKTHKARIVRWIDPISFERFVDSANPSNTKSIFIQFYEWLDRVHGLPDKLPLSDMGTMHVRCRIGQHVMDRLYKLEIKRIQKTRRLARVDAVRAVASADAGHGPHTLQGFEIYVDETLE